MMPVAICASVSAAGLSHQTWISEPGFLVGSVRVRPPWKRSGVQVSYIHLVSGLAPPST